MREDGQGLKEKEWRGENMRVSKKIDFIENTKKRVMGG